MVIGRAEPTMKQKILGGRTSELLSNTFIFTVGDALTKMLQLVLMPLYTGFMTVEDYSVAELVNNLSDLLYPVLCLCVFEAVFRFAMSCDADRGALLVDALLLLFVTMSFGIVVAAVSYLQLGYELSWACLALTFSVGLRTILAQFARGIGEVRRFAASGVLNTFLLLLFAVILLVGLDLGVAGYVGALLFGNAGSALYLIVSCKLWRYASSRPDGALLRRMLAYSFPLLPSTLAWWFMSISGRYVLLYSQGIVVAGLYTAACKLPSLVNFLSSIFQQAWQISAVQEIESDDGIDYFSRVFSAFLAFLCCGCSFLITFSLPLAAVLLQGEFFDGWRYVPTVMLATFIGSMSSYFETFYSAAMQTRRIFTSTVLGALINVILTLCLVDALGVWGVVLASIVAQTFTLIFRVIDSRRFAPLSYDSIPQLLSVLALVAQTVLVSTLDQMAGLVSSAIVCLVVCVYHGYRYRGYMAAIEHVMAGKVKMVLHGLGRRD